MSSSSRENQQEPKRYQENQWQSRKRPMQWRRFFQSLPTSLGYVPLQCVLLRTTWKSMPEQIRDTDMIFKTHYNLRPETCWCEAICCRHWFGNWDPPSAFTCFHDPFHPRMLMQDVAFDDGGLGGSSDEDVPLAVRKPVWIDLERGLNVEISVVFHPTSVVIDPTWPSSQGILSASINCMFKWDIWHRLHCLLAVTKVAKCLGRLPSQIPCLVMYEMDYCACWRGFILVRAIELATTLELVTANPCQQLLVS